MSYKTFFSPFYWQNNNTRVFGLLTTWALYNIQVERLESKQKHASLFSHLEKEEGKVFRISNAKDDNDTTTISNLLSVINAAPRHSGE